MKRLVPVSLVVLMAGCHRDHPAPPSIGAEPAQSSSASTIPAPATMPVVADGASRALMASARASNPLRLFLRRDGSAVWAFDVPGGLKLRGTFQADGRVTFAESDAGAPQLELRPRPDGSAELRSSKPDGGALTVIALVESVPWPATDTKLDSGFALEIGHVAARAQIRRDGSALSGFYRYGKSTSDLAIAGTVDATGRFTITERTDAGQISGQWSGIFLGATAAAGTWTSPDGKRRLPLTMTAAAPLAPTPPPAPNTGLATLETVQKEESGGANCTNSARYPRVSGLVPASRNAVLNKALVALLADRDTVACDEDKDPPWNAGIDVEVVAQVPGFMVITVSEGSYSGGAHPLSSGYCLVLDTRTAAPVSLLEALGPRASDRVVEAARAGLHQYYQDNQFDRDYVDLDGGAFTLDDKNVCYRDAHHLDIRYSPYAVAPYVYGEVSVPVDLDPILPLATRTPGVDALFPPKGD